MKYKIIYSDGETFDIECKDLYEGLTKYMNEIRWSWITAIIEIAW